MKNLEDISQPPTDQKISINNTDVTTNYNFFNLFHIRIKFIFFA